MIFADASTLLAVIAGEADADAMADRMQAASVRLCSAMSAWETTAGLCRSHAVPVPAARAQVRRSLDTSPFRFVAITEREFSVR